ncbi:septal ring lytic transglycosylase RlpA family protein [Pasteurella dagmatis]|nr:septal ring lytic transglycosylase RlpA family protein [Pasteurella dagmatis]
MKIQKIFKLLSALLMLSFAGFSLAETKKLYGVKGPKLAYQTHYKQADTYVVKGVTYSTTPTDKAKNYSREGIASFYHKKFNGRKTANGEIYNENLYTAAHKTLPLNSYALVTNLRNNRKVIVRINDRGPFIKGRIIDLSRAAAGEIGAIGSGLSKVRVEALHVNRQGKISGPATNTLAKMAKTDDARARLITFKDADTRDTDDKYTEKTDSKNKKAIASTQYQLRAMSVGSKKQAENLIAKLEHKNLIAEIKQNGKKYDIYFGPFKEKREVDELKTQLRNMNYSKPVIVYSFDN